MKRRVMELLRHNKGNCDAMLILISPMVGVLVACSISGWISLTDRGRSEIREAKMELLANADLLDLHNRIHSEVGESAWENLVKPRFMASVTRETVLENGDLLPDWRDVVQWVRQHPQEARRLMEKASEGIPRR